MGGSLSFKDCITDITCKPERFDPLGLSQDEGEEEFSVHAGMLMCMQDMKMQLSQWGTLTEAFRPGGKAYGYNIVCTGHSLGAGIAVLLALDLRATYGDAVRYVGYEPP